MAYLISPLARAARSLPDRSRLGRVNAGYLEELEKAGFLEIRQRGLGKTNLYRLSLTIQKLPKGGRA